ncbi:UNVERIFIED_CONTAM: hypothetical protein GTU68_048072 [Idotea baltica]|nr:hypothetical protein [Idotea baltica]
MHPMLNTATAAALKAGKYISQQTQRLDQLVIDRKDKNDFVTDVDRTVEADIVAALTRAYPDHGIIGEEGSAINPDADFQWIIDPLDGTTNFLYGIPHFAISIAVTYKGRLEHAVIYDPTLDELFTASRGDGARLNNRRIRVSSRRSMDGALLSTGIPFHSRHLHLLDTHLGTMRALIPNTAGVRRQGSAALDLAYVAAGRFDGFWEFDLNSWDMAAGILLIQEAGGLISDMQGGTTYMESGHVVAASPKIFKEMLKRIHPVLEKAPELTRMPTSGVEQADEEVTTSKPTLSLSGKSKS